MRITHVHAHHPHSRHPHPHPFTSSRLHVITSSPTSSRHPMRVIHINIIQSHHPHSRHPHPHSRHHVVPTYIVTSSTFTSYSHVIPIHVTSFSSPFKSSRLHVITSSLLRHVIHIHIIQSRHPHSRHYIHLKFREK